MFEDYPDVLSAEEAAEALRISENAIYRLLNEGRLKAFKNGRTWKIPKEALRSYVLEAAKLRNLRVSANNGWRIFSANSAV